MAIAVKKLPANGHKRRTLIPFGWENTLRRKRTLFQQENFPWTEDWRAKQAKSQTQLSTPTSTVYIYMHYKCNKWWQIHKPTNIHIPDCKVFTGKQLPSQGLYFPASPLYLDGPK